MAFVAIDNKTTCIVRTNGQTYQVVQELGMASSVPRRLVRILEHGVAFIENAAPNTKICLLTDTPARFDVPTATVDEFQVLGNSLWISYKLEFWQRPMDGDWRKIPLPKQVSFPGKSLDGMLLKDGRLLLIDNLLMPKYFVEYDLNSGEFEVEQFNVSPNGRVIDTFAGDDFFVLRSSFGNRSGRGYDLRVHDLGTLEFRIGTVSNESNGDLPIISVDTFSNYVVFLSGTDTQKELRYFKVAGEEYWVPSKLIPTSADLTHIEDIGIDPSGNIWGMTKISTHLLAASEFA